MKWWHAVIAGAVVLLLVAAMLLIDAGAFFRGYLFAWVLWLGPALGAAALLMLHQLTGGKWGTAVRFELGSAASALPWAALLFAPLLVGMWWLYPWAQQPVHSEGELIHFKPAYLQPWFFSLRSGVYLVLWAVGGWLLFSATRREHAVRFAGGGLVLYFLTATFASYDWLASLEPDWYSSVYALYTIIGQAVAAQALVILLVARRPDIDAKTLNDLGNLLLAMVVLWAYLAYSQFFIIWNADLPHQSAWYLRRIEHGWGMVAVVLIAIHFVLPFAALLMRTVKQRGRALMRVGGLVLVAHALDVAWRVLPAFEINLATAISAALAVVGIGACLGGAFMWAQQHRPREPAHA